MAKVASPPVYCILSPGKLNDDIVNRTLLENNVLDVVVHHLNDGYTLFVLQEELNPMVSRLIDDYSWITLMNERELAHFLMETMQRGTQSLRIFRPHPHH